MAATKSYRDALAEMSDEARSKFLKNPNRWKIEVGGFLQPPGTDVRISSPFGEVRTVVVMNDDGTPAFDRPDYREAPATNLVVYGIEDDGTVKIAALSQYRPHADDPFNQGVDGHKAVLIGQVPQGFLDKMGGGKLETPEEGGLREAGEEAGAQGFISVERPKIPWQNNNPSHERGWIDVLFIKVDLKRIEALRHDKKEPIYAANYVTVKELFRLIREGRGEDGALFRACNSNSTWMIFFATYPEFLKQL